MKRRELIKHLEVKIEHLISIIEHEKKQYEEYKCEESLSVYRYYLGRLETLKELIKELDSF